ncbi:membrane dipeptidase [Flavisolibacter sp. BT320]|nr:membrane dipeptidase [Flavisolibacter longurius]
MIVLLRMLALFSIFLFSCQSYKRLHRNALVVDTHNDVLSTATMRGLSIESDLTGRTHTDLARLKKGGVDVQVFAVFCDERFGKDTAFKYANREIDSLYAIVGRNTDKLILATNPAQLEQAVSEKKIACMLGVEGGHMIEDNLAYLDSFYKRGVRYLTLTWNNSTSWATSAMDETAASKPLVGWSSSQPSPATKPENSTSASQSGDSAAGHPSTGGAGGGQKGLTPFGKQVVQRMNELGMMVDVSHVGEQTFWDAINTSTKPVIASHSCAYTLCPVFRNLKDDQLKALAKNGGVVQLNFYSGFLDSSFQARMQDFNSRHRKERDSLRALKWPSYQIEEYFLATYPEEASRLRPPLSLLLDHIDHMVRVAGIDHVGLGSDFDGISSAPKELQDVTDMPLITKGLLQRGYSKADIRKILGENFLRVFKANQSTEPKPILSSSN